MTQLRISGVIEINTQFKKGQGTFVNELTASKCRIP